MKRIDSLLRDNIKTLQPYSSAREEYLGKEGIFLDANENPYGSLNRYPDPLQSSLKQALSDINGISTDSIFIGNGSDEIIDLCFRIFCTPGKEKAVTISPSYGMYDVSAAINDVELAKVPLEKDFSLNPAKIGEAVSQPGVKLFILCSPNNPTANAFPKEEIIRVLKKFQGIILIDEAYIDFSKTGSWISELDRLPNLIVSQSFSKSMGLAAARIGIAYASKEIISPLTRVKPPYNVSTLNQEAAIASIANINTNKKIIDTILKSREWLKEKLESLPTVNMIYPSDTNFLLVEFNDGPSVFNELIRKKIITRNRNNLVKNAIRITIGSEKENEALINELKRITI